MKSPLRSRWISLLTLAVTLPLTANADLRWADDETEYFHNLDWWSSDTSSAPIAPTGNTTPLSDQNLFVYNNSNVMLLPGYAFSIGALNLNSDVNGASGSVTALNQSGGDLTITTNLDIGGTGAGANYLITGSTLGTKALRFGSSVANLLNVTGGTVTVTDPLTTNYNIKLGGTGAAAGRFAVNRLQMAGNLNDTTSTLELRGDSAFTITSTSGNTYLANEKRNTVNISIADNATFTTNNRTYLTHGDDALLNLTLTGNGTFESTGDHLIFGVGPDADVNITMGGTSRLLRSGSEIGTTFIDGNYDRVTVRAVLNDSAQFIVNKQLTLGHADDNNSGSTATLTLNGTSRFQAGTLILGRSDRVGQSPNAYIHLNGGTLAAEIILQGGASSNVPNQDSGKVIHANGGTIQALAAQTEFFGKTDTGVANLTVNLQEGGLVFDTQGFAIGTAQKLSGTGDLTKVGTGTLTLSGDQSGWTGALNVTEGAVELAGATVLSIVLDGAKGGTGAVDAETLHGATGGTLTLADGATLNVVLNNAGSLGVGTYTYNIFTGNVNYDESAIVVTSAVGGGITYTLNGNGTLTVQVVPEPSTYGLLFGAGALLCAVRLRRSR